MMLLWVVSEKHQLGSEVSKGCFHVLPCLVYPLYGYSTVLAVFTSPTLLVDCTQSPFIFRHLSVILYVYLYVIIKNSKASLSICSARNCLVTFLLCHGLTVFLHMQLPFSWQENHFIQIATQPNYHHKLIGWVFIPQPNPTLTGILARTTQAYVSVAITWC